MNTAIYDKILTKLEPKILDKDELLADLHALWPSKSPAQLRKLLSRPAMLRKLALILAQNVPLGTNRIVVDSVETLVIGVALSLETGISFTSLDESDHQLFGELLERESWVYLAVQEPTEDRLNHLSKEHKLVSLTVLSLSGSGESTHGFKLVNLLQEKN